MKLGFIGTGNMAGAIMGGIIREGIIAPEEIIGADILEAGRNRVRETYGINVTADNREAAGGIRRARSLSEAPVYCRGRSPRRSGTVSQKRRSS